MLAATSSQTIGPFWHALADPALADLLRFGATGDPIVLTGTVRDGDDQPVGDACIECWQSDPPADDSFPGWGRAATDAAGTFRLTTLRPGPVRGAGNTTQAPHIALAIFARGLLVPLHTRAYFAGDPLNAEDPLLSAITDPARRATLLAQPEAGPSWRLDIRLQGGAETVFLAV